MCNFFITLQRLMYKEINKIFYMKKVIIILMLALGVYTEYSFAEKVKFTEQNLIAKVDKPNSGSKTVSSQDMDDNSDDEKDADDDATNNNANPIDALAKQQDSIDNANDSVQNAQNNSSVDNLAKIIKDKSVTDFNPFTVAIVGTAGIYLVIILFLLFLFLYKYKSKRAKYHIAEEALKAGQPIPEGLFKKDEPVSTRTVYRTTPEGKRVKHIEMTSNSLKEKGIKNICLGVGLFIFLWALTKVFGLGCIGLLVACTGIGQFLIARNRQIDDMNNFTNNPEPEHKKESTLQEEQATESTSEENKDEASE